MNVLWFFDGVLAVTLVGLAVRALTTADRFEAVVSFIVFGLLMAVAWTRLHAPDIALAEAAIGAGLTGGLFLNSLRHLGHDEPKPISERGRWIVLSILVLLLFALGGVLGMVVWQLPAEAPGLGPHVEAKLPRSGVGNPVTAVLLNFRAYDTLLEIGVLLLAVIGVWALGPAPGPHRDVDSPGPVLLAFVRILVPVMIVVAADLLWLGTTAPGGAFQAGAVLTAAGVLLVVAGVLRPPALRRRRERGALIAGFAIFLAIGIGVMSSGHRFLQYPQEWAGSLILLVEAVLTLSIALTLVALFAGGPPESGRGHLARTDETAP